MIPYLPKTFELGETPRFDDLPVLDDSGNQWHIYQMSALGNRFLIVDENTHPFEPTSEQIIDLADKSAEWDQLLAFQEAKYPWQLAVKVWNRDGSRAENCGNGVRCLAALQMFRTQKQDEAKRQMEFSISIGNSPLIETRCSIYTIENSRSQSVISHIDYIAMTHEKIPATAPANVLINEKINGVQSAAEVRYGNPHLVLFLDDSTSPQKEALQGGKLEADLRDSGIPFYRRGVNISFAQIRADEAAIKELGSKAKARIDLQVWERGAGLTRSCGSGAAATWHAAFKQKLIDNDYSSWEDPINIFNAFHIALKPIRLKIYVPDFFNGELDINAFRAVSAMEMGHYLIGNSQIERGGMLTL